MMLTVSSLGVAKSISGTVTVKKDLTEKIQGKGVLFVFARTFGAQGGPPAAVKRIPSPKFPQTFSLSQEDAMIPGSPFDGPFTLVARWTDSGNAMQKNGAFEGTTSSKKGVKPGDKGVQVEINEARK